MHPDRTATGLLLALALTLGACSSDSEPKIAAPDPTPPVTSAPTATTPPVVEAWEARTVDGANAFVTHWINELNAVAATGQTRDLRTISDAQCVTCKNLIDFIDGVYAAGGNIEGGEWSVVESSGIATDSRVSPAFLSAQIRQAPQHIVKESGTDDVEAKKVTLALTMTWDDTRWRMSEIKIP